MRYIWENRWFLVPVLIFLIIGGLLAWLVPYGTEILFFNDFRYEPWNSLFHFLTQCGEAIAFVLFGIPLLFWKPRYVAVLALVGGLSMPLNFAFKHYMGVDRPITYFEKNIASKQPVLVPGVLLNRGQTSFPSGHSMAAFALFSLLGLMLPPKQRKWGLFFSTLAILTAISRVFLVQHFLIDIVVGAILGMVLSQVCWQILYPFTHPKALA